MDKALASSASPGESTDTRSGLGSLPNPRPPPQVLSARQQPINLFLLIGSVRSINFYLSAASPAECSSLAEITTSQLKFSILGRAWDIPNLETTEVEPHVGDSWDDPRSGPHHVVCTSRWTSVVLHHIDLRHLLDRFDSLSSYFQSAE